MIGIFNTITIDGTEYPRPNGFAPEREDVYRGEYETCTGAIMADRIGWRYSDISLEWDMLTADQLAALTSISGAAILAFEDSDGAHSETVIRTGFQNAPTRITLSNGAAVWRNVKLGFKFIDVHGAS